MTEQRINDAAKQIVTRAIKKANKSKNKTIALINAYIKTIMDYAVTRPLGELLNATSIVAVLEERMAMIRG